MSVTSSLSKIGESVAVWLNPEKKEVRILRGAIEAAEELMKIYQKRAPYDKLPARRVTELERHYLKRWLAWKDGRT